MKVFVSYARGDDEPFVRRLVDHLNARGLEVWFDRRSMPSRSLTFMDEIRRAIDAADRLLVVLGPAGVSSEYVRSEWQYALARAKAVTPVLRLGDYGSVPAELSSLHCPDARPDRPETESLAEIARVLSEPVLPLGELSGLPSLPPHFRPRPDETSALIACLLGDQTTTTPAENWRRVTLVSGMGGVGKSVLAASSAGSTSVRRVFTDGIFWVDARDHPDSTGLAEFVLRQVQPVAAADGGLPVEERLQRSLRGRRCLIVLDNAGDVRQVATLAQCLDATGRLLVTSRDAELADDILVLPLGGLSATAGRQLLADWIGAEAARDPSDYLVRRCEGLPFALALCGAMAAHDIPLELIAERVAAADLDFLEHRFPGYPYPSLLPMLDASLGVLRTRSAQAADLFPTLCVFRDGARVPVATVARFWQHRSDLTKAHVAKHLSLLHGLSLIRLESREGQQEVQLHQLVHDYATALIGDAAALHRDLLDAYGVRSGAELADGPDDGYYHANLIHHLLRAGLTELAVSTLTASAAWLRSKQHAPGRRGTFAGDVDLVLGTLGEAENGTALDVLVRLRTARHVSQRGPSAWGPSVLQAMVAVGDDADALSSIRATADPMLRLNQLLEIISQLQRANRPAPELLGEARTVRDTEQDPERQRTMDQALTRFAAMNDPVTAIDAWMRLGGDREDAADLGPLLAGRLLRQGALEDARRVAEHSPGARAVVELRVALLAGHLDEVQRRLAHLPSGPEGIALRHEAIAGLVEAGRYELAREVARTSDENMRVLVLAGIPEEGAVLEALQGARRLPPGFHRAQGLLSCAQALERLRNAVPEQRRPRRSWSRFQRRSKTGARDGTGQAAVDPAELVQESLREADSASPSEKTFILMAHAQRALVRKDPQAADLVRSWRSAIGADPEPTYRAENLGRMALALAEAGDIGAAKAALADATAAAETAEATDNAETALAAVLPAFAANGHFEAAFDRALAITDNLRRARALLALARVCGNKGLADEAAVLVGHTAHEPDSGKFAVAYAQALARRGRASEALQASEGLEETDRARTLSEIAVVLADAGLLEAAHDAADRLPLTPGDRYYRVAACCALARATAGSDRRTAEEWLALAEQSMPSPPSLAFSLARTTRASAVAAVHPDEADAAFRKAIDAARTVEEPQLSLGAIAGPTARWRALETVGKALADNGSPGEALELARSVEEDAPEWEALKASVIAYAAVRLHRQRRQAGDVFAEASRHAAAVADTFIGTNWRLLASGAVAHGYCEAGEWQDGLAAIDRLHPSLDIYLAALAECCDSRFQPFALAHLTAAMQIIGWIRPEWRQLAAEMAQ